MTNKRYKHRANVRWRAALQPDAPPVCHHARNCTLFQQLTDSERAAAALRYRALAALRHFKKRGTTNTATTTTSSAADPGRSRNTPHLPSPMDSALRICASASGPRIMPTTTGAVGKS